ncbi:MAG: hypothetical protein ACQESZ_06370 [Bacteroidota bacterium]
MSKLIHPLSKFQINHDFYPRLTLLVTIKSFDLQAIRKRYLKTRDKTSQRTGSADRREVTLGGVAAITFEKGRIINAEVLTRLKEPRGIDMKGDILALSSENKVYLVKDRVEVIEDSWFSYIHTVDIHPHNFSRLLVSSSGFDAFFEYDMDTKEQTFEWFAWENGFDHGYDPQTGEKVFLTRWPEKAQALRGGGKPVMLINDPANQVLPTARRAAFINSVVYDQKSPDRIIATLFHEGAVYSIDKHSSAKERILDDMLSPHGGARWSEHYMATNTKGGQVVIGSNQHQNRYDFSQLKGKPRELADFEWIQNAVNIGDVIVAIDSNRNAFVVFQPHSKQLDFIPFDANWAVQDLIHGNLSVHQKQLLEEISEK